MTLFHATNLLADYFKKNTSYSNEKNFKDLFTIDSDDDKILKQSVITESLARLEKEQFVCKVKNKDGFDTWVLVKPLVHFEQQVTLAGDTAVLLAEIVNGFANTTNDEYNLCSPFSINERNIVYLLNIIQSIKNANQ